MSSLRILNTIGDFSEHDISNIISINISRKNLADRVKILILRDLLNLNWQVNFTSEKIEVSPPSYYDKDVIKDSMSIKRNEILNKNKSWIKKHINTARENLAAGKDVIESSIEPLIEVCQTPTQHALFRIYRYYWSSPYSEYVGRRIKLIIRDNALPNKPVIGIAALGSPIIHIPERDKWIGWDKKLRTNNLVYAMDAYVIGALPPYNYLLGGKLVSYILASNEVRKIYEQKYKDKITLINNRKAKDLVCLFTTGLYGKSSQYNRLKHKNRLLYKLIGETKGYGTLHLTEETFSMMLKYLKSKNIDIKNRFGDGPSWRMRVIRTVGDKLGFDSNILLRHSFQRSIYVVPLIRNLKSYLKGINIKANYFDCAMKTLVDFWKRRWLNNRKLRLDVINKVLSFRTSDFEI